MADNGVHLNGNGTQTPRQQAADGLAARMRPEHPQAGLHADLVEEELLQHLTSDYKRQLPIYNFRDEYWVGPEFYWDIDAMLMHDCIKTPLDYVMAPLSQMQIQGEASSTRVLKFLFDEWSKFKEIWMPLVQDAGYSWGWAGAELVYGIEAGKLVQKEFHDFASRDVQPLVLRNRVVGVQVSSIGLEGSKLQNRHGVPSKAFWYPHRPTAGCHYGTSQLRGAWKPWRRLTGRDGLEEIMDLGMYRYGAGQTVIKAPIADVKAKNQPPGQDRQSTLERAREMAEQMKAGGAIAMPSDVYEGSGKEKWGLDSFQPDMKLQELIAGADYLEKKCSKGIGFPPELLEAAETGSGFSGRLIPLHGFLMSQDRTAKGLFHAWFKQIGEPLIKWNFGRNAWVKCKTIPLLQCYRQATQPAGQPGATPQVPAQAPAPQGQQPAQAAAAPAAPGADGKIPYHGPRHGEGWRDAQGRVHYTHHLSTDSAAAIGAAEAIEKGMDGEDARTNLLRLAKYLPELEADELDALAEAIETSQRPAIAPPVTLATPVVPTPRNSITVVPFATPMAAANSNRSDDLREVGQMLSDTLRALPQPQPVHIAPATVNVSPPTVNVSPPQIHLSTQFPERVAGEFAQAVQAMRDEMQEQRQQTSDAIERLCDGLANLPAPVVHVEQQKIDAPIVNVAPPIVRVMMPEPGAVRTIPKYDASGKVVEVIKEPVGEAKVPTAEITPATVEVK